MDSGQVNVRIRRSVDWRDLSREGVRVTILDSGTGMTPEIRHNIFEPFFTTKELKGSGLGLWLSTGIVTRHQGRISVRSSTDPARHGTCFSLFLPAKNTMRSSPAHTEQNAVA